MASALSVRPCLTVLKNQKKFLIVFGIRLMYVMPKYESKFIPDIANFSKNSFREIFIAWMIFIAKAV